MAQPTPYASDTEFFSFELADAQFPGQELDIEFANIRITLDEILANLELIQRDDGAIANESVGYDQLDPALLAGGIYPLMAWETATLYSQYQVVVRDTKLYQATENHTSGTFSTDLAAGKWEELVDLAVDFPDLSAIEALSGTGIVRRTGDDTWSTGTTVSVAEGGTGATTASGARTALGVVPGTDVQTQSARLSEIAALAVTDDNIIVGNGSAWVAESGATARTSLGLGALAPLSTVGTSQIDDAAVSNAKRADMAEATVSGRAAGAGTGVPTDLTQTQLTALVNTFTSGLSGAVPASGGGTTNFLRADGSFAAPGGGGVTSIGVQAAASGTTVTFSSIPAWDILAFAFAALSHNGTGGANQALQIETSTNNGGAWSTPVALYGTALAAALSNSGGLLMFSTSSGQVCFGAYGSQGIGALTASTGAVDAVRFSWSLGGSFDDANGTITGAILS